MHALLSQFYHYHLFVGALTIDRSTVYQTVIGFGGAFTDAAGINIHSLSNETQEQLLKSYFSTDGEFFVTVA